MDEMNCPEGDAAQAGPAPGAGFRSGVAARLAGVPVETLRVWERRYGLSSPQRSARGQRLYSEEQVRRLSLIKQLVDQGHPIGALAGLVPAQLRELAAHRQARAAPARPIRAVMIGEGLARRLALGSRSAAAFDILQTVARLDSAATVKEQGADLLLVEVPELLAEAVPLIETVTRAAAARAVVVMYRFGAGAIVRRLRAQGMLVARVPADVDEIVMLCETAVAGPEEAKALARAAPPPRRLDDTALAHLAAAASGVSCECPRHLADILVMLASFERYSAQCASRSPAEMRLHQDLNEAAGQARVLLEAAMERLARAEGLPWPR
jgi:DNA-binding transcriptional MerR regulator